MTTTTTVRNVLRIAIILYGSLQLIIQHLFIQESSSLEGNNANWEWTYDAPIRDTVELDSIVANPSLSSENTTRKHPHAGARFPNGSYGYIVDVTLVREQHIQNFNADQDNHQNQLVEPSNYLPFNSEELNAVCNSEPGKPELEGRFGWRLLRRMKVKASNFQHKPKSKILCAIYTHEKKHDAVTAVGETWGWRCDGFFAASTKTVTDPKEPGLGAVDLPHEGKEEYANMWQKVRSIWAYVHDHYIDDFDYFYLAGDDTHVVVENLRAYLDSLGPTARSEPLYSGFWIPDTRPFPPRLGFYFCGGGGGYVLNKRALRILVRYLLPRCRANMRIASEDKIIGECFRKVGIVGNRSVDEFGSQLFHGEDPQFVAHYKNGDDPQFVHHFSNASGYDRPMYNKKYFRPIYNFWGRHFGQKQGLVLASNNSISFHRLDGMKLKRHHAIIYKSCPKGTLLGDILEP